MRVLLTGGFGYIGGRLGQHLISCGHEVVLGSRKRQAIPTWLPQARVIQTDWENRTSLFNACGDIEVIVHAAGMNSIDSYQSPKLALEFNGFATASLVDVAMSCGVKKFIYISTAHVYSNPLVGDITENSPTSNQHPYATSHLAGEKAVMAANERNQMQVAIARLSNTFGAPAHRGANCWMLLVNDLCRQAIVQRKMVLNTHGLQVRDFLPITDTCRAIEYLINCDTNYFPSNIFNIGGGTKTVVEMARMIQGCCEDILGMRPSIEKPINPCNETVKKLFYKMNWLENSEFEFVTDGHIEISQLLAFCKATFFRETAIKK